MRLGKEQAVGYVEDTEAEPLPAIEDSSVVAGQPDGVPAAVPEPSLTTG